MDVIHGIMGVSAVMEPVPLKHLRDKDDLQLLKSIAERSDATAFEELFRRYQSTAYNLARHMTLNAEWAEEITQEALLRMWTSASNFKYSDNVRGWLLKIVVRESIRRIRKNRAEMNRISRKHELNYAQAPAPPSATQETQEDLVILRAKLKEISEAQRHILALYYGAELSQKEIGKLLGMPQNTVSRRIHEAIEHLRSRMAPSGCSASALMVSTTSLRKGLLEGDSPQNDLWVRVSARLNQAAKQSLRTASITHSIAWSLTTAAVFCLATIATIVVWHLTLDKNESGPISATRSATVSPTSRTKVSQLAKDTDDQSFNWLWNFDTPALPQEFEKLTGFVQMDEREASGRLLLAGEKGTEPWILLNKRMNSRFVKIKVQLQAINRTDESFRVAFMITDRKSAAPVGQWTKEAPELPGPKTYIDHWYLLEDFCVVCSENEKSEIRVFSVARIQRRPNDRYLILTGTNARVLKLEIQSIENSDIPDFVRHSLNHWSQTYGDSPSVELPRISLPAQ